MPLGQTPPNPWKLKLANGREIWVYIDPELNLGEMVTCDAEGHTVMPERDPVGIIVHPDVSAALWRASQP